MRLALKPQTTAALRRFTTDFHPSPQSLPPTDSSCPNSETLSLLQTSDPDSWPANPKLGALLSAVSPRSILSITRQLPNYQNALQFFIYLKSNPHLSDSASPAFQALLELAMRENPKAPGKLYELFEMAKDQNTPLSVNAGTLLVSCFGRKKMLEEMLKVFDAMDEQVKNTHVLNLVIDGMLRWGRLDDALKMLDKMLEPDARYAPNISTFVYVISSVMNRRWRGRRLRDEEICNLVSRFVQRGVCLDGYWLTQIISRFCKSGDYDKAWFVLHEGMSSGTDVEVVSCNMLLMGLGRHRDIARMNLLMKEMKEKGIKPNILTYGIMIKYFCKIGRLDEGLEVLDKMETGEAGVEPDIVIYNTLIDGLCKVGRQEEGLKLLEKMMSESKCVPNTVTYNSLIDGFCKAGDFDKGRELFERMSDLGVEVNVVTLNTMVDGMCKRGRVSSAMDLFGHMREKGLQGNAITYTTLITAFCAANNIDKAMKLYDEMQENDCSPDAITYYSLIAGLTRAGRMDDATFIMSVMKETGFSLDIVGYNIMLGGFCRKNKLDKAAELLKDMEQTGLNPDRVTYNTLLSYYCERGDFTLVRRVVKKMISDGLTPSVVTYGALIQGYCANNNLDAAMRIFKDMKATSKVSPNTVIYNMLIDSHCKKDNVEGAIDLMEDMKARGVKPNTTTYNALFKGLHQRNLYERALDFMNQMTEQNCLPDYVTMEILTEWLPAFGLALLKVGGRMVVYSTCSMNPVENEAVVSEVLRRCKGTVELVDVCTELPQLARRPGIKKWRVRDKGLWLTSYKDVRKYRQSVATPGMFPSGKSYDELSETDHETATGQICENSNDNNHNEGKSIGDSGAPTSNLEAEVSDLPLERCMRIVPHDQNSGAFFIAVFCKRFPLPAPTVTQKKPKSLNGADSCTAESLKQIKMKEGRNEDDIDVSGETDVQISEAAMGASLLDTGIGVSYLNTDQNKIHEQNEKEDKMGMILMQVVTQMLKFLKQLWMPIYSILELVKLIQTLT